MRRRYRADSSIFLRVNSDLKDYALSAADKERKSLSRYIIDLIVKDLEEKKIIHQGNSWRIY